MILQDRTGINRKDEVMIKAVRLHNASCFTRTISQSSVSFPNTTINKEPSIYARDSVLVCACASVMKTVAISLPVWPVVFTLLFIFLLHNGKLFKSKPVQHLWHRSVTFLPQIVPLVGFIVTSGRNGCNTTLCTKSGQQSDEGLGF